MGGSTTNQKVSVYIPIILEQYETVQLLGKLMRFTILISIRNIGDHDDLLWEFPFNQPVPKMRTDGMGWGFFEPIYNSHFCGWVLNPMHPHYTPCGWYFHEYPIHIPSYIHRISPFDFPWKSHETMVFPIDFPSISLGNPHGFHQQKLPRQVELRLAVNPVSLEPVVDVLEPLWPWFCHGISGGNGRENLWEIPCGWDFSWDLVVKRICNMVMN